MIPSIIFPKLDKFPYVPTPEPDFPWWFESDFDEMDEF